MRVNRLIQAYRVGAHFDGREILLMMLQPKISVRFGIAFKSEGQSSSVVQSGRQAQIASPWTWR